MGRVSPYRVAQANYIRGLDNNPAALTEAYNEVDCKVMAEVLAYLRRHR